MPFHSLGAEELVIKTKNNHLLLAGGRPRGTLYAVSRFLQRHFKPLPEAEKLWQQAEAAAASNPDFLDRIRLGHLAVRYVWLSRWMQLRKECDALSAKWPLPESHKQVADDWMVIANGVPGKGWTKITLLNEAGLTPEKWGEGKVPAKR